MKHQLLGILVIFVTASCRDSAKQEAKNASPEAEAKAQDSSNKKDDPGLIPQIVTYSGLFEDERGPGEPQDLIIKLPTSESSKSLLEKINGISVPQTYGMFGVIIVNVLEDQKPAQSIVDAAGKQQEGKITIIIKSSDGSVLVEMTLAKSKITELNAFHVK